MANYRGSLWAGRLDASESEAATGIPRVGLGRVMGEWLVTMEELKYCRSKQSIPSCSSYFSARDISVTCGRGVTAAHLHALPCWEFLLSAQAWRMEEAAEMNLGIEKCGLHPG